MAVFKAQNQAASEIMLLLPELDPDDPATTALIEADAAMLEACEPLNRMAVALREGQQPTRRQRRQMPGGISACRQATLETRSLLDAGLQEATL